MPGSERRMGKSPQPLKRWAVFLSILLAFSLLISKAQAASQPLPVDTFWEQVSATLAWLDSSHSPAEWADQAQAWTQINEVALADGQISKIDTSEITRRMSANPPDVGSLKTFLESLQAGQTRWPQASCADCKDSAMAGILARPEFAQINPGGDFFQQLLKSIGDAINQLLQKLFPASGGSLPNPTMFIVVISILVILILFASFGDIFRNLYTEADVAGVLPGEDAPLTASSASKKAAQSAGTGDYRSAIRYLYLSALLLLDERGFLRYDHTLTNREYLQQLGEEGEIKRNLKAIVDEFDRVWYGFYPIGQEEYSRYLSHIAAIAAIKK